MMITYSAPISEPGFKIQFFRHEALLAKPCDCIIELTRRTMRGCLDVGRNSWPEGG
jgi:hypothetical protein